MTRFRIWLSADPVRGVVLSLVGVLVSFLNVVYVLFAKGCE